jgi:hypothetical protein
MPPIIILLLRATSMLSLPIDFILPAVVEFNFQFHRFTGVTVSVAGRLRLEGRPRERDR